MYNCEVYNLLFTAVNPKEIVQVYIDALNNNDMDACEKFFTEDAVVVMPVFGEKKAREFFRDTYYV